MNNPDNSGAVVYAALIRGLLVALASGVSAGLSLLATGADDRTAFIGGASAAVAALLVRFGGEGILDSNRAKSGNVWASDVGRSVTTTTVNTPIVPPVA